jgi:uncharacterized membrane protein YeaQ/YmgE (transglycosylase-associated protein family)
MSRSFLVAVLSGALVLGAIAPSQAAQGRKKSLLTGVAVGAVGAVAAGVVANKLMGSGQQAPAAAVEEEEDAPVRPTGSIRRVRAVEEPSCRIRPTKLFTEDGTYVKTERLEICR